jgi:hypothetical protein
MKLLIGIGVLALAGCASVPDIKADNIKDGTVICGTVTAPFGSAKTVVAKLEAGVIRDGGMVAVDANCVMNIQLIPPAPKQVAAPAPTAPLVK